MTAPKRQAQVWFRRGTVELLETDPTHVCNVVVDCTEECTVKFVEEEPLLAELNLRNREVTALEIENLSLSRALRRERALRAEEKASSPGSEKLLRDWVEAEAALEVAKRDANKASGNRVGNAVWAHRAAERMLEDAKRAAKKCVARKAGL